MFIIVLYVFGLTFMQGVVSFLLRQNDLEVGFASPNVTGPNSASRLGTLAERQLLKLAFLVVACQPNWVRPIPKRRVMQFRLAHVRVPGAVE